MEVAAAAPVVSDAPAERLARAHAAMRRPVGAFDPVDAAAKLDRMLAATA
jgi:hypothetical protein